MDFVGLRQSDEMSDGPGYDVAVAVEVAFTSRGCAQDSGEISGDGGFFSKDGYGAGIG